MTTVTARVMAVHQYELASGETLMLVYRVQQSGEELVLMHSEEVRRQDEVARVLQEARKSIEQAAHKAGLKGTATIRQEGQGDA